MRSSIWLDTKDQRFLINSRSASSALARGWWLELDHGGSECERIASLVSVLDSLCNLSVLVRELFQLLLVRSVSLHLSFVLLLVLPDQLMLLALRLTHVGLSELIGGCLDQI